MQDDFKTSEKINLCIYCQQYEIIFYLFVYIVCFFFVCCVPHQRPGEQSNEDMSSQEVPKVEAVLSSFLNDESSQLGNSAVMCQGNSNVEEYLQTES